MNEWTRCRELIDELANDYALFQNKSKLILRMAETTGITECRVTVVTMQHELNGKLLKYHELIEKLDYKNKEDRNVLESFYAYIFNGMNERADEINSFLDILGRLITDYIQFSECVLDNKILNDAIRCVQKNTNGR